MSISTVFKGEIEVSHEEKIGLVDIVDDFCRETFAVCVGGFVSAVERLYPLAAVLHESRLECLTDDIATSLQLSTREATIFEVVFEHIPSELDGVLIPLDE